MLALVGPCWVVVLVASPADLNSGTVATYVNIAILTELDPQFPLRQIRSIDLFRRISGIHPFSGQMALATLNA